jgi:hypothetical protein
MERRQLRTCAFQTNRGVQALSQKNTDQHIARRQAIFLLHLASFSGVHEQALAVIPGLDPPLGFK